VNDKPRRNIIKDTYCPRCGMTLPLKVCTSAAGSYWGWWCDECGPAGRLSGYWGEKC